ncbi:MAG: hypothetical protein H7Y11_09215, partial [Armatimonadetes bacterium]|nr:hypothetical protein [Anaerolineae bacterium]
QSIYPVDAVVNHRDVPLYVFAINGNDRCRDATIKLHTYRSWGIRFHSVTIFENQQDIARSVLARFSDVADKQFSSLISSEPQIKRYLAEQLAITSG